LSRVLITGAAGFTGHYLAQAFSGLGHELHGIVNGHTGGAIEGYARLHEADLCDGTAIHDVLSQIQPSHIIHLAAISFVAHSDVDEMYRVNIMGTRHLLEAAGDLRRQPASILLSSSANVYGNARGGVIEETVPLAPANDYGVTKAAMELVASIYQPTLPIIIVRPFNYTGRGQSSQFIIPKILEHVRKRAAVIELGNLEVERDFSDVRAVADAYVRLMATPAAIGQTFNICSGRAVALRDILDLAMKLSGHRMEVRVNPAFVRANEVHSLRGSVISIERRIGSLLHVSLEETLRWMLNP
jgi:nucleoside-diphosphate-sugar epimerase